VGEKLKKFYIFVLGLIFSFNLVWADNQVIKLSKEINEVGIVHQYKTSENSCVGFNLNLEMLYIATMTGSGFTHPAYNMENEISQTIKSYYSQFQDNKYAQKFNQLSLKYKYNPQNKFSTQVVAEVLSYPEMISSRVLKDSSSTNTMQDDLQHFCDETDSKQFFAKNLLKYNQMTADFIAKYPSNYLSELDDFFGTKMSKDKFQILLSPLYKGGSAVPFQNQDQTMNYISIVNPFYENIYVTNVIIHENTHHFLYSVLLKKRNLIKEYQKYLKQSFGEAKGFVKNNYESFLNEFLARVITITLVDRYYSPEMAYKLWLIEKKQGWDKLDEVYALIKNKYLPRREQYLLFEDFLPVILEYFKAKSTGKTFEIGSKIFELPETIKEIKEVTIHNIYWEQDSRISKFKAAKAHSILLEVEFSSIKDLAMISNPRELIDKFLHKASTEFNLVAKGKPKVTAQIYTLNSYNINGKDIYGFWAVIDDIEYNKLESGVSYNLVPKKQNRKYKWIIDENVKLVVENMEN